MRNLIIIVVVFWLLFLNGFSTIGKLINSSAPQAVVRGAATVVSSSNTGGVAAAPASGVQIAKKPTVMVRTFGGGTSGGVQVVPQEMPQLPTATESFEVPPTIESATIPTPINAIPVLSAEPVISEQSNPEDWESGGGPEIIVNTPLPDVPTPIPTPTPQPEDPFRVGAVVQVVGGNFKVGEQGEVIIADSSPPYMMLVKFLNGDSFSFPKANLQIIIGGGGGGSGWD